MWTVQEHYKGEGRTTEVLGDYATFAEAIADVRDDVENEAARLWGLVIPFEWQAEYGPMADADAHAVERAAWAGEADEVRIPVTMRNVEVIIRRA